MAVEAKEDLRLLVVPSGALCKGGNSETGDTGDKLYLPQSSSAKVGLAVSMFQPPTTKDDKYYIY